MPLGVECEDRQRRRAPDVALALICEHLQTCERFSNAKSRRSSSLGQEHRDTSSLVSAPPSYTKHLVGINFQPRWPQQSCVWVRGGWATQFSIEKPQGCRRLVVLLCPGCTGSHGRVHVLCLGFYLTWRNRKANSTQMSGQQSFDRLPPQASCLWCCCFYCECPFSRRLTDNCDGIYNDLQHFIVGILHVQFILSLSRALFLSLSLSHTLTLGLPPPVLGLADSGMKFWVKSSECCSRA